jgi:hypothetical protein
MKNSAIQNFQPGTGVAARNRSLSLVLVLAGFVASLLLNLPGHLSYDSVIQLLDGRTGEYHTWHPPVMAWLLGLGDALLPGTASFVIACAALNFAAFGSLLWLKDRTGWLTALVALLCVLTPQFLLYQGIVWKDVLFANAALAGFVCLAHAARLWPRTVLRFIWLTAATFLFVLAALTRQNGLIVLLTGAAGLGWIAAKQSGFKTGSLYGFSALLIAAVLFAGVSGLLSLRTTHDNGTAAQITLLEAYDLIGTVKRDPGYRLQILERETPKLAAAMRTDGVKLYSPYKNDTLEASMSLEEGLAAPASASPLARQWRDLVFRHGWLYLRTRLDVFAQVFLTPVLQQCVPFYVGVDGPAEEMGELGMTRRWDATDRIQAAYAGHFVGTPVFSHAAFAALGILMLALLWRRSAPTDIAMGCMLASMLAFTISFFVISIACDYRYLYALDMSVLYALFYLA